MGPVVSLWVCSIFSSLLLALLDAYLMEILHSNFAQQFHAGWWYKDCFEAALNNRITGYAVY